MLLSLSIPAVPSLDAALERRARELVSARHRVLNVRTDRLFLWLMIVQWMSGMLLASTITPLTWEGTSSTLHPHVMSSIVLGGAISGLSWCWLIARPGSVATRHVVAVMQMLWSSLLIHLTGGRIETHFHIFGSLAFLAFYRDARVLVTATIVVAVDHLLRGILWPYSVYGVLNATLWRTVEHAAWVVFEDFFLILAIRLSLAEMWDNAVAHAELEESHKHVEDEVVRRTSELKATEDKLRQSQKMEAIGRLAGGVAHDFNNLLCVISGYSEALCEDYAPDEPAHEMGAEISQAASRATALTRQLLIFSRRQMTAPETLDLNQVVRNSQSMLGRLIGEDVHLAAVLDPILDHVRTDAGQMEQVIMNMAVNARDAMPRGGQLTIETRNVELGEQFGASRPDFRPGRYVLLTVSDTGRGMDNAVKARLFEPFFTTKEKGKGTGLGLATVYGIVKQWDGHIDVYSEVGVGTTFKVYLPAVAVERSSRGDAMTDRPDSKGNETILLAEDQEAVREFAGRTLARKGYRIVTAVNGQDALRVARSHQEPIDLLLTDVVMPGMGGRELAESLTSEHPGLPVLFMSGYTDDAVVRHGILAAETNFLQKPFNGESLAAKVREVLDAEAVRESPIGGAAR